MSAGRRWLAPYAATLFAMLALQMSNLGFSPLLPAIRGAFHMSFAQMGLFAGMYGLLSIAWSVPAGLLAKRFGEKVVLAMGLVTVAVGLAALSLAPSFAAAFGARAVWLSGYRFAFVCVMVAVALTCPPAVRGASMGILGAISALASVIGAPLGGMIGRISDGGTEFSRTPESHWRERWCSRFSIAAIRRQATHAPYTPARFPPALSGVLWFGRSRRFPVWPEWAA